MSAAGLRYALIVGHGRSGSNWVLSMLNANPAVHARNEPHLLGGSPYAGLPSAAGTAQGAPEMDRTWDHFVGWSCGRDGERDPRNFVRKDFERWWASRTGASDWPVRPRIRRALATVVPGLRRPEWRPLPVLVDRSRHDGAFHVLKLNDLRFWHARWVLEQRPEVPVVHLVRHPGGQLRSAWSRFFGRLDEAGRRSEEQVYRSAVASSFEVAPRWRERVGDVADLSLDEAVMWFWRINNEEIHLAGRDRPAYRHVTYEHLVEAPVEVARELFDHVGLAWTPAAEREVRDGLGRSVWGPVATSRRDLVAGWHEALEPHQRRIVEQVLADGPMASWW